MYCNKAATLINNVYIESVDCKRAGISFLMTIIKFSLEIIPLSNMCKFSSSFFVLHLSFQSHLWLFNWLIILGWENVGVVIRIFQKIFTVTVTVLTPLFFFTTISSAYFQINISRILFRFLELSAAREKFLYIGKTSLGPSCIYIYTHLRLFIVIFQLL